MTRPDFAEGLHPQLDCDLVNKRKIEYMTKLEARLGIECPGCPGCPDDCPDALDVCANTIAEFARKTTSLEFELGKRTEQLETMARLVREAMTDSTLAEHVGPGCWYCDQSDVCLTSCRAANAMESCDFGADGP